MTQELWNILTKTTDWVKYSDTKAVLLLTLHGVVLTVIYTNANSVYEFSSSNWFTILLTFAIAGTSLASIIYSFLVVNPRLKNNNPTSLIYFGHIQEKFKNYTDYFQSAKAVLNDKEKLDEQLAEQIHINSKVAWKKYSFIGLSFRYFFATIILFSVTLLYYFISK
jgi:Family of unknown function (DUF5706)